MGRALGDPPLLTVSTEDTGGRFGDCSQPRRGNRLSTFLTEAVLAAAKALERLGELICLLDEGASGAEAPLALLTLGAELSLVARHAMLSTGIGKFVEYDATAQMADPVDGVVELGSQQILHLVHRLSSATQAPCLGALAGLLASGTPVSGPAAQRVSGRIGEKSTHHE
jgi:hypothetical protein